MNWIVGPPASGKTTYLLNLAHQTLAQRGRVWWVGLPTQRDYLLRQAAVQCAQVGLEFLSFQRLYYLLLASNLGLQPLLTGPGRIALVGEALLDSGLSPKPGEARLFARAIAEAKRYGLEPTQLPTHDPETRRLVQVYARYEALRQAWGRWDYDDFRLAALQLVEGPTHQWALPDGLKRIILDGFRSLAPLEARLVEALSQRLEVWVSLPYLPPGIQPRVVLEKAHQPTALYQYHATNEMAEARWLMRALKQDLGQGVDSCDLAVIAPPSQIPGLLALGKEYGLPLADHTPTTAAGTPQGRLLLDLLSLPDHPSPTQLLAIPELARLGQVALERGLAGRPALGLLAQQLGVADYWQGWLERLEPSGPLVAWSESLLNSLPQLDGPARQLLLERAREAARIATGSDFRHWWAALIAETRLPTRPAPGIALLSPAQVSGVRFDRVYLISATYGRYSPGEEEDYFIPEEYRLPADQVRAGQELPHRLAGLTPLFLQELISRGRKVVVSYARARPGSLLEPEPLLVGVDPPPLPRLPAASVAEMGHQAQAPFAFMPAQVDLATATVEQLRIFADCPFRAWALQRLPPAPLPGSAELLLEELLRLRRLDQSRLETLANRYHEWAGWLRGYSQQLTQLDYGFVLSHPHGWEARVDALKRSGPLLDLYLFGHQGQHANGREAFEDRWNEVWSAGYWLSRPHSPIRQVRLWFWPVGAAAQLAYDASHQKNLLGRFRKIDRQLARLLAGYQQGKVEPTPGYHCHHCTLADLCRATPQSGG
jgi:ATP-dependent helicase/nuclease subunit B